jgi:hypothetical protein
MPQRSAGSRAPPAAATVGADEAPGAALQGETLH